MPEIRRLPPVAVGYRWKATTEGDYRLNPDTVYKSEYEGIYGGCAYWELRDPRGAKITLREYANTATPTTGQRGIVQQPPTQPMPTRIRTIRVSGLPGSVTIFGTFSPQAERALADRWLSQYEYTFLQQLLPGSHRGGIANDALDLLEILRQIRLPHGYRPTANKIDDLYNLGHLGDATLPKLANYSQLPRTRRLVNSFILRFDAAQITGLMPVDTLPPARLATVNRVFNARMAQIIGDPNLAPDDRTVLLSIQIVTLMNWMVRPIPRPPAAPLPPLVLRLTVGGAIFNVPALNPTQQLTYQSCLALKPIGVSDANRGKYGSGSLLPLRRFAQPILDSIFLGAGGAPPGWQWPVFP